MDDWGLAPLSDMERRHLLEVLDDRHECRSTIMTSQFEVGTWHDLIGNSTLGDAIMERILSHHHEIVLKGETMRPIKKAIAADSRALSLSSLPISVKEKEVRT